MFWEREPYVWQEDGQRVSRFISLGSFGGGVEGKKQRVRQFQDQRFQFLTLVSGFTHSPSHLMIHQGKRH